ncbi:hypothetical protein PAGA_a3275 [Pseudoalteromonas agarivorans DSM 14585]|uniref:Uncharacterized protein n=1 Tax=Pseudoalteromonas agarivorans DSM 14585 TaxID=1312369 RepID=A0ACA8DYV9_9GAMM|nr:hypothetical protein PAGA_a3275 [Pseudoalteromonas agarivorans DSM 14585]
MGFQRNPLKLMTCYILYLKQINMRVSILVFMFLATKQKHPLKKQVLYSLFN